MYCLLENKLKMLSDINNKIILLSQEEHHEGDGRFTRNSGPHLRILKENRRLWASHQLWTLSSLHSAWKAQGSKQCTQATVAKVSTEIQGYWMDLVLGLFHQNDQISTIDKFNYLYSLLEGNTARTNYNNAIEMLWEHFGKLQIIVSAHQDSILKLKPALMAGLDHCLTSMIRSAGHVR